MTKRVIYCIVPRELAAKLHEPLRRHFLDDAEIEVIVERRSRERRAESDRRAAPGELRERRNEGERRRIRNRAGRRVGERRAVLVPVDPPREMPRRFQRFGEQIAFFERVAPASGPEEDLEIGRIVTRIQAGEREAFADLYIRYFDRVYAYLRLLLRDPHEAEDLTQQVFTQLIQDIGRYERRTQPFRAWLFTIVRRLGIDHLRRHRRLELSDMQGAERDTEVATEDEPSVAALDWIDDRDLLLFVERLPLAQRQVLTLRYMFDCTHAEIASILGRSQADVRTLQHRAVSFLRSRLRALGRDAVGRRRARMRVYRRQAPVLRMRRFSLSP